MNVVIIGRPNTGKSTLFNRLLGRKRALVHDFPGVTRDRLQESTKWPKQGAEGTVDVTLVDTGGLGGEHFAEEIEKQVQIALTDADVVLFVLDAKAGLMTDDEKLWTKLKRSGFLKDRPVIGVVNKVDHSNHEEMIADFFSLGLDNVLTISAEHGRGIDDLKALISSFAVTPVQDESVVRGSEQRTSRIAIVGRPNVGKSTLINAILGEERMIASPVAGTTVDAVDSIVELNGVSYVLVDTAGIRRKAKTQQGVEVLSIVQTKKALEKADLAILVLDGEGGISDQDEKIGGLIEEMGCSIIIVLNKWDTQQKNKDFTKDMAAEIIRKKMPFLKYAPLIFMSALYRKGLDLNEIGGLIEEILHQRKLRIPTHELTEWIRKESTIHNPKNAKFYLAQQIGSFPPSFTCHVNDPDKIHFSLERHLINAMREKWGYMGTPIRLRFTK